MSFKKLTPGTTTGRVGATSVRVANNNGKQPRINIPISVLDELGARIGSRVDLMIDEECHPRKLAIVAPGKMAKLLKAPGASLGAMVMASALRNAIPLCSTVVVNHEVGRIDGCAALIIDLPDAASLSKEREGA